MVREEALPLLFARNTFQFDNTTAFKAFVKEAGDSAAFLTNVEIDLGSEVPESTKYVADALKGLQKMTKLKRLQLSFGGLYGELDDVAARLWAGVGPFVTGAVGSKGKQCIGVGAEEQKRRFESVHYMVGVSGRKNEVPSLREERHDAIKVAIRKKWQGHGLTGP